MKENFGQIVDFVLKHEGYKSNHPDDPGGLTIWGFSQKYFPEIVKELSSLDEDVSYHRAGDFYRRLFWDKLHCDDIPTPLDCVLFDTAVNIGISKAVKLLQQILVILCCNIEVDGIMGPKTLDCINKVGKDPLVLTLYYIGARLSYYKNLDNFKVFGRGWVQRVADLCWFVADLVHKRKLR